jgi:hypothetical protein
MDVLVKESQRAFQMAMHTKAQNTVTWMTKKKCRDGSKWSRTFTLVIANHNVRKEVIQ